MCLCLETFQFLRKLELNLLNLRIEWKAFSQNSIGGFHILIPYLKINVRIHQFETFGKLSNNERIKIKLFNMELLSLRDSIAKAHNSHFDR